MSTLDGLTAMRNSTLEDIDAVDRKLEQYGLSAEEFRDLDRERGELVEHLDKIETEIEAVTAREAAKAAERKAESERAKVDAREAAEFAARQLPLVFP